ncbi:type 1 glutamine amidotransferase domain-containing protein [Pseudomonas corrugata]|uniref:Type 1 glutamine amidotransferase domain-containing protein n=1 Tax=Pseudomonas corrugata TaxID=47879 RepID=A0A7Y5ZAX9_9PSED|nr:type 1 glutamine amidotransferase domain-containing protein [Pseudomonas corrugata]MCI0996605.1 type 1 glutamine amidotransferase domain-containing protein [Pseudomonas corrugata]NUT65605.1 type 1 glutamine amidotransferase domain-containing protein [Pseudomonas corrugata]NUT89106.1 type 1 glutamine amidotransferase domain-containing protein [Pseudomonas corrugata]
MSVLFVLTSHDAFGDTGRKTGLWLEEFLAPYYRFIDAGLAVRLASPKGGRVPVDPASVEALKDSALYQRYASDAVLGERMNSTVRLSAVNAGDVSALVYPGGHGPLWDLRDNPASVALIESFSGSDKPVATICHAGCALLDARKSDGRPLVEGLQVTAFSDSEEAAVGLDKAVPYLVEADMRALGAVYSKAGDWESHVVVSGSLVTGQNPASSLGVADAVMKLLKR